MADDVTWRLVRVALCLVISATLSLSLVPHAEVHAAGAVPLMLLVTDSANTADPFGPYLGEILRAEGLPTFATADISALTPAMLSTSGIVTLGPTSGISTDQVTMLTNFVQGGGRLLAMRPPTSLAPLFGVTPAGGTTTEPYMKIVGSGLGAGFNTTPLQVHPSADTYTLNGATAVATLYNSFTTATPYAAVTTKSIGQGQAMLWAYDLAQSIVYTRQSNPARVGEHDGAPGYRTTDLFAGYVNLNDVPIPQADEQQRLLAQGDRGTERGSDTASLVFPAECRDRAGPDRGCAREPNVVFHKRAEQHSEVSAGTSPSISRRPHPRRVGCRGVGAGGEWSRHPTLCRRRFRNRVLVPMPDIGKGTIGDQQAWFQVQFGLPASPTVRIHYFSWQCWSDAASIEASRRDADGHGLLCMGSMAAKTGRHMGARIHQRQRFADADGRCDRAYHPRLSAVDFAR